MNNTQLAAEIAALREEIARERRTRQAQFGDYDKALFDLDTYVKAHIDHHPQPPTPTPDDDAKWEAWGHTLTHLITNCLADGCKVEEVGWWLAPALQNAFDIGLAIDPARLVVTDAMVDNALDISYWAGRGVSTPLRDSMRAALEAAFAMVKKVNP